MTEMTVKSQVANATVSQNHLPHKPHESGFNAVAQIQNRCCKPVVLRWQNYHQQRPADCQSIVTRVRVSSKKTGFLYPQELGTRKVHSILVTSMQAKLRW